MRKYKIIKITDLKGIEKESYFQVNDIIELRGSLNIEIPAQFIIIERENIIKCYIPAHTSTVKSLTRKNNYVIMTTRNSIYTLVEI